jgi:cation diffusion facilitator family transporter
MSRAGPVDREVAAKGHQAAPVQGDESAPAAGHGHGGRAIIAALLANMALAAGKLVGFVFTGSSSMLAESVHSLADTGNQGLLLLGGRRSRKVADEEHPFGYGRERYFWSFVVALVLFSLGALFAIYEGIHKIQHPEPIDRPEWAIGILCFALVMESLSFRTAVRESAAIKGDATFVQFVRRTKVPELPVVLLEDLGARSGLVLALGAVTMALITDDGVWDGYCTLCIGILLGIIAIVLAIEMKSLLIGEGAGPQRIDAIRTAIKGEPSVTALIHLRTEHLGPDELLVCAKVEFRHELTVVELADMIDRLEATVRAAVPEARVIYIEPDVHHSQRSRPPANQRG